MQLDSALAKYEPFFIQCGIFLMLEKLKIITYRTLFKKVLVFFRREIYFFIKQILKMCLLMQLGAGF